jgi:hypothetical protein
VTAFLAAIREIRGSNGSSMFSGEYQSPLDLFPSAITATARARKPDEITAQIRGKILAFCILNSAFSSTIP